MHSLIVCVLAKVIIILFKNLKPYHTLKVNLKTNAAKTLTSHTQIQLFFSEVNNFKIASTTSNQIYITSIIVYNF